jgi:gas vesicle protein
MSNKKSGVFPMLVGAVAGAAAVFFSDKKNQEKAKKAVAKGKASIQKISNEVKKNPEAYAKKMAKKVTVEAKKIGKKIQDQAKKIK